MRGERRAIEGAGALLGDDDVALLRFEFRPYGVIGRVNGWLRALGSAHEGGTALAAHIAGRKKDREARGASGGEQPFGRLDRLIGIPSARARMGLDQFNRRFRSAAIRQLVEIDGE